MKFGVRHSKALDENYDIVDIGSTTDLNTNREERNERQPGFHSTENEPSLASAIMGTANGVLLVEATLPLIKQIGDSGYYGMVSKPQVTHAFLNGVNKIIRDQFTNLPLSAAKIPRVVFCSVDGGESFAVRINEKGIVFDGRDNPWLRARAIVAQPWNMGMTDVELEETGLQLMLTDHVPTNIQKGLSE